MTKLRKKSFTVVEQACHEIRGFRKLPEDLDDKVRLSGHAMGTLKSYSPKLAQLSLLLGKLPRHISDKEVNKYLAELTRRSKTSSLSDFKFAVFSLRDCCHFAGYHRQNGQYRVPNASCSGKSGKRCQTRRPQPSNNPKSKPKTPVLPQNLTFARTAKPGP